LLQGDIISCNPVSRLQLNPLLKFDLDISTSHLDSYDLIDVTRQVLSKFANVVFDRLLDAYEKSDAAEVFKQGEILVRTIADMEEALRTREELLLGPWLESAKALGVTDEEKKLVRSFPSCDFFPFF
jgi:hypothetical protein